MKTEGEAQAGMWGKIGAAGAAAALALTAVVGASVAIGVSAVQSAADFNSQMMLVRTQAHDTTDNITELGNAVLALAPTVGIGPDQLAEGLYHVTSVGYRGAEAMQILKVAAEGSKVGMASLDDTAYALTSTMNTFGLKGDQAQATMATLNAIVGAGDMKFQNLNAAIGSGFFAAGETFGVSIQSMGAALAYLTDRGASADEAATRLKMSINLLGAPSKQASGILKDLGLSQSEITQRTSAMEQALRKSGVTTTQLSNDLRGPDGIQVALQDLVNHMQKAGLSADETAAVLSRAFGGGRSGAAIMSMVQHLDTLKSKFDMINEGQARFGSDVSDTMSTLNSRVDQVKAGFEAWRIEIGEKLMPVASELLGWFASRLPALQAWGDAFADRMIPAAVQFGQAVGKLLPPLAPLAGVFLGLAPLLFFAGTVVADILAPALQMLAGSAGLLEPILAGLAAGWAAWNIAMAVTEGLAMGAALLELIGTLSALVAGENLATIATVAFDLAMDANPIGVVILAVAALAAVVVVCAQHWSEITAVLHVFWGKVQQVAATISTFIEQHKALAIAIGVLTGPIGLVVGGLSLLVSHWNEVSSAAGKAGGAIHDFFLGNDAAAKAAAASTKAAKDALVAHGDITVVTQLKAQGAPPELVHAAVLKAAKDSYVATESAQAAHHAKMQAARRGFIQTALADAGGFFSRLGSLTQAGIARAGAIFSGLGSIVHDALMHLVSLAEEAWQQFSSRPAYWIGVGLADVIVGLYELQGHITDWFAGVLANAAKWAYDMVNRAEDMAVKLMVAIGKEWQALPGQVWTWLGAVLPVVALFAAKLSDKAGEAGKDLVIAIANEWMKLPGQAWDIGADIVRGLYQGFMSLTGWLTQQINSFFSGLVDGAKAALGIHSPSALFAAEVGLPIAQGVAHGIGQGAPAALQAMGALLSGIGGPASARGPEMTASLSTVNQGSRATQIAPAYSSAGGPGGATTIELHTHIQLGDQEFTALVQRIQDSRLTRLLTAT